MSTLTRRYFSLGTAAAAAVHSANSARPQSAADKVGTGRDHNHVGFSVWMAGAGLKPGFSYGSTDELGYKADANPVPWHDFHATVLHLLGIDHQRLTYYHNGIQRRLTNVHGEALKDIIA